VEANLGSGFILICGIMGLLKAADCRHNKHSSSTTSIVVVGLSGAVLQAISTIAHESGHYFASRLLGIKVNGVGVDFLRAYVSVEFPENSKAKPAIGILAGPAASLAFAGVLFAARQNSSGLTQTILTNEIEVGICSGLYNLIPTPISDGGRLLELALQKHIPDHTLRIKVVTGCGIAAHLAWNKFNVNRQIRQILTS